MAADILKNEFSCNNFHVLNANEIQIEGFLDTPEILVQAFIKNNVMVSNVNQSGLNLEEYFIELVGGIHNA